MINETMINNAYEKSLEVLKRNIREHGFFASETVYHDVWARDSMIILMGGALLDDLNVKRACFNSMEILKKYQSEVGQIPNSVPFRNKDGDKIDYGEYYGGAVDATLWYIIGVYYYYRIYNDEEFLERYFDSLNKAVFWLRCQDSDNCGLIEIHESGNWMDLLSNQGKVLYDNVLWYKVLTCYSELINKRNELEAKKYRELSERVKNKINALFWSDAPSKIYGANKAHALMRESKYYIAYITSRDFGWRCDSYANLLSVLFNVAEEKRANEIIQFMINIGIDQPYLIKALYPPIYPGDENWRDYFIDHCLNLPNQYHNGGIWPYLGGFWACALNKIKNKDVAEKVLYKLAITNKQGLNEEWEFNEWLHGVTGRPMGAPYQAWSASMYILAYNIIRLNKKIPLF